MCSYDFYHSERSQISVCKLNAGSELSNILCTEHHLVLDLEFSGDVFFVIVLLLRFYGVLLSLLQSLSFILDSLDPFRYYRRLPLWNIVLNVQFDGWVKSVKCPKWRNPSCGVYGVIISEFSKC